MGKSAGDTQLEKDAAKMAAGRKAVIRVAKDTPVIQVGNGPASGVQVHDPLAFGLTAASTDNPVKTTIQMTGTDKNGKPAAKITFTMPTGVTLLGGPAFVELRS